MSKEVSEELGFLIDRIRTLGWKEIRDWNDFFAVFKPPQWNIKHLEQRIVTNFLHYRSNYVVICGVILLLQIILTPTVLLSLIIICAYSTYLLVLVKGPLVIADYTIAENNKKILCLVSSLVFLILTGALQTLLLSLVICSSICLIHMIFRPRSVTSKANKTYEEVKFSGMSWFSSSSTSTQSNEYTDPENPLSPSPSTHAIRKRGPTTSFNPNTNANVPVLSDYLSPTANFKTGGRKAD